MYLGKEEASEDEDKEPFTSVPDVSVTITNMTKLTYCLHLQGFQHALRECMLNGYLEVGSTRLTHVRV